MTGTSYYDGNHLIGNPFASALLWNTGWSLSNVSSVASVWGETAQNYLSLSNAGDIIPANQGFFVQVSNAVNSFTIPASARTHSSTAFYKDSPADFLKFRITNSANETYDETIVRMNPEATAGYDVAFDGHKLTGSNIAPQLYTRISEDEFLSVNTLSSIVAPEIVEMGFKANVEAEYTLTAIENTFNWAITLEDRFTGTFTELGQNTVYVFSAQPGADVNRFALHFSGTVGTEDPMSDEQIKIYSNNGNIFLSNAPAQSEISILNLTGQVVLRGSANGNGLTTINANSLPEGIYIVNVVTGNQSVSKKVSIR